MGSLSSLMVRVTGGEKMRPTNYLHLKDRENVHGKMNYVLDLVSLPPPTNYVMEERMMFHRI